MLEVLKQRKETLEMGVLLSQRLIEEHLYVYGPAESEDEDAKAKLNELIKGQMIFDVSRGFYDPPAVTEQDDPDKLLALFPVLSETYAEVVKEFNEKDELTDEEKGKNIALANIMDGECKYATLIVENFKKKGFDSNAGNSEN